MNKIVVLIGIGFCLLSLESCTGYSGKHLDYKSGPSIPLNKITGSTDYIEKGAYYYGQDTVASHFDILSGTHHLFVIKLDSLYLDFGVKPIAYEPYEYVDAKYSTMFGSTMDLQYNITDISEIDLIKTLQVRSDGKIRIGVLNDSIKEHYTTFKKLTVNYNNDTHARFTAEAKNDTVAAALLFYRGHKGSYIFIMTSPSGIIEKGSLYNYLFKSKF